MEIRRGGARRAIRSRSLRAPRDDALHGRRLRCARRTRASRAGDGRTPPPGGVDRQVRRLGADHRLHGHLPCRTRIRTASRSTPSTASCPGRSVVVSTGGSRRNAPWGELLSTAAIARGARGAVVDGLVRDVRRIQELRVPAVCRRHEAGGLEGPRAVVACNVPVECGGVLVDAGRSRVCRSRRRHHHPGGDRRGSGAAGHRQGLAREPQPRGTAATARTCVRSTTSTGCSLSLTSP